MIGESPYIWDGPGADFKEFVTSSRCLSFVMWHKSPHHPRARTGHRPMHQTPKPDEGWALHSPCWILHPAQGGTSHWQHPLHALHGGPDLWHLQVALLIFYQILCFMFFIFFIMKYFDIAKNSTEEHTTSIYGPILLDKRETIPDTNKALCSLQSLFSL